MSRESALDRAIRMAEAAIGQQPAGVLADLDGTLAPIVRDPGAVRLVDGAEERLAALAARVAVVGVITGRAAHDARRIINLPQLLVIGNHGMEWWLPGAAAPELPREAAELRAKVGRILSAVPPGAGIRIEHKGLSATVHYRQTRDPGRSRERILAALAPVAGEGIELREGRMSVEIRPIGVADKGTATRAVVDRHRLRGLLVMGDDRTDLDMFRTADGLRAAGRLTAAVIGVGGGGEVPPEVAKAVDVLLADPREVVRLLRALA